MFDVGSPFHPSVVNPSRVQLVGGWEKVMDPQSKSIVLHLHEPFSLEFDTRAAGPGFHFISLNFTEDHQYRLVGTGLMLYTHVTQHGYFKSF